MSESDVESEASRSSFGEEFHGDKTNEKNKSPSKKKESVKYRRIEFKDDEEGKLIELVKSKPFLYCVTDPEYKDRLLKKKAWNDIGIILSKTADDCKKKWKNIKDAFDRSRK